MDDDRRRLGGVDFRHGEAIYPPFGWVATAGLLLLCFLGVARAAGRGELEANGRWRSFVLGTPGKVETWQFICTAGCRYRLTVEGRTLPRVKVEVGPASSTRWRADSTKVPPPDASSPRPTARLVFDADVDDVYQIRVRSFSLMTGKGRIKLETLDARDRPWEAHRRFLKPGEILARVGSLWVDDKNEWLLHLEPGERYEIRSRPGTSGPIRLCVLEADGTVVAQVGPSAGRPWPSLVFEAPRALDGEVSPLRLVVEALDGAGGTYGVFLLAASRRRGGDPGGSDPPGGTRPPPGTPLPGAAATDSLEDLPNPPLAFRAGTGDLAVLYIPKVPNWAPSQVARLAVGGDWVTLGDDPLTRAGRQASMTTPEAASLVWFSPHRAGTWRFIERRRKGAVLRLYPAAEIKGGPLLLGTGLDPTVWARGERTWKTIGYGVCMPGWPYLFVAAARRRTSVAMRVETVDGSRLASRPARGVALPRVAGVGPSLRFSVKAPTVVRLQVKGRRWEGYALLRRASR